MIRNYKLGHKLVAAILLVTLFLQSCLNPPILPVSTHEKHHLEQGSIKGQLLGISSLEHEDILTKTTNTAALVPIKDQLQTNQSQKNTTTSHIQPRFFNNTEEKLVHKSANQPIKKTPQEISPNSHSEEQSEKRLSYTFKMQQGWQLTIYQQGKKWEANIREKIGVFKRESCLLFVYIEPGMSLQKLINLPKPIQEQYIHIVLPRPSMNQPGYVYIGKKGLLGGMKKAKGKEKMTPEEEEKQAKQQEDNNPTIQFERGKASYKFWKQQRRESDCQEAIKWLNRAAGQGHPKAERLLSRFENELIQARADQQSTNQGEVKGLSNIDLVDRWEKIDTRKRKINRELDQNNPLPNNELSSRKKRKIGVEEESEKQESDKKMVKVGLTDIPEESFSLEYRIKENAYLDLLNKKILPYVKKKSKKSPSCFISYAWGDPSHVSWVKRFSEMLSNAGIDVWLDKWTIKRGHILTEFVKKIEKADWVIVVGTKLYLKKYNKRAKSIGEKEHVARIEGLLIDYLISYSTKMGNKVIPVLLEGTSEESLPFMVQPKIAAEFTINDYFEEILKLIRDLYSIENRDKSFEGFMERYRKSASAAASTITAEEMDAYKEKRTSRILASDQKILEDVAIYKARAFNISGSSSDEGSSDEEAGSQTELRMMSLTNSTFSKVCPLHNYLATGMLNDYIPRPNEQKKLDQALRQAGICVVTGHGGIGKSTLVAGYGLKQKAKQVVRWLLAETSEKLVNSYIKLAKELKIDYQELAQEYKQDRDQYLAELAKKIYDSLEDDNQPTLLILDNASDPTLIASCLLHNSPYAGRGYNS